MQQLRRSRGSSAAKPIAAWLSGLERSNALASHAEMLLRLQAIYARCVPPGMANASELANVRDGVAVVIAHSGAVAHRLRMLAPSLVLALRKGGAAVSELKVVAQAIEMHESTVSRVTSNKFMATPRGMFELKYFFSAAIQSTDGGEAHSAESVRHRIRALIDAETADEVLSDDRIVEILQEAGVEIARRTVAKYREAMRIPSSVERRRLMVR